MTEDEQGFGPVRNVIVLGGRGKKRVSQRMQCNRQEMDRRRTVEGGQMEAAVRRSFLYTSALWRRMHSARPYCPYSFFKDPRASFLWSNIDGRAVGSLTQSSLHHQLPRSL